MLKQIATLIVATGSLIGSANADAGQLDVTAGESNLQIFLKSSDERRYPAEPIVVPARKTKTLELPQGPIDIRIRVAVERGVYEDLGLDHLDLDRLAERPGGFNGRLRLKRWATWEQIDDGWLKTTYEEQDEVAVPATAVQGKATLYFGRVAGHSSPFPPPPPPPKRP